MKKLPIFLLMSIFLFSFISAYAVQELNENSNITITCFDDGYCDASTFCNINIEDPNGDMILTNTNMTYTTSFFYHQLNVTELGSYKITGFCKDGTNSKEIDFLFGGKEGTIIELITGIVLILLIIALMIAIKIKYKGVDFNKWNDKIKETHENIGKTFTKGLLHGLMKNVFIWFYFLGWLILFILVGIVAMLNNSEIYGYFLLILDIYSLGFILVLILLIGYFVQYMKTMIDDLVSESWGVV